MTPAPNRRWPETVRTVASGSRLLRVPPLLASLVLSIGTAIAFVFWIYWDPAFVLDTFHDNYWWRFWSEDGGVTGRFLGVRWVAFGLLALSAIVSTLFVVAGVCIGKRQDRSLLSIFLLVAAVGIWLLLFVRYDDLTWLAIQGRIYRMMPKFKQDVALLLGDPSTIRGTLPLSGAYVSVEPLSSDVSRQIEIVDPDDPIECILECNDKSLRFALRYHDARHGALSVEHRPDGSLPPAIWGDDMPQNWIQLEPHWFLIHWIFD